MVRLPVLTLVIAVLALPAIAPGAPVVGTSANTLPHGKFMIDLWGAWQTYDRQYVEDLNGEGDPGWVELPDDVVFTSASLVPRILYGVTDWLTLRVALPIEDRFRDFPDAEGQAVSTGLGDVVFDPKVLLFTSKSGDGKVSFLSGVRFPTGATESEVPLSDGSTDFGMGLAWTQKMGSVSGHLCSFYWMNGESEAGVDLRNQSATTLTIESPIAEDWSILWEGRMILGEDPREFHRVAACPGVSWNATGRLTVGLSGVFSVAAKGDPAYSTFDSTVGPFIRVYYRFY